jgi:hypothetical protein
MPARILPSRVIVTIAAALAVASVVLPYALRSHADQPPSADVRAVLALPERVGDKPNDDPADALTITPEGHKSIDRGMEWLLGAMNSHGQFGGDIGHPPDLSCTAMAGLALLAEGNTPHGGRHMRELQLVTDAVLTMAERLPTGPRKGQEMVLVQRKIGANADRFFAALFLSEVLGEAGDSDAEIRLALTKLVNDICASQGQDGTWGDESWAPILGTVMGWESLRSSASGGLKVEASAQAAGKALLEKLKSAVNEQESWMHDFYKNASSIRVLYSMGYRSEPAYSAALKKTIRFAWEDRPFTEAGGEEFLGFFLVTECLLQDEAQWGPQWYPTVQRKLVRVQNTDGSWTGHHCITHRTFCTAAALLTLQAPNLYLSMSNQ